jgi:NADH:ubiquinone oxidoreductase subunit D
VALETFRVPLASAPAAVAAADVPAVVGSLDIVMGEIDR